MTVSYTHLDVYKRQTPALGTIDMRQQLNWIECLTTVSYTHLWLVPLVAYLTYESVLIFEKDELNINGKKVLYRSNKKVQIIENKNKYHLIIRAKGNEYLYKTNQKNSQHVLECLKKYCPRIDKNRD